MREIRKKIWPEYFEAISSGHKTFDLRLADFDCATGDVLVLEEWDPKTKNYTGRTLRKTISYVLKTKQAQFWPKEEVKKHGLQILGFNE